MNLRTQPQNGQNRGNSHTSATHGGWLSRGKVSPHLRGVSSNFFEKTMRQPGPAEKLGRPRYGCEAAECKAGKGDMLGAATTGGAAGSPVRKASLHTCQAGAGVGQFRIQFQRLAVVGASLVLLALLLHDRSEVVVHLGGGQDGGKLDVGVVQPAGSGEH